MYSERAEFSRNKGFLLAADVGHQVQDISSGFSVPPVEVPTERELRYAGRLNPAEAGLLLFAREVFEPMATIQNYKSLTFKAAFGISSDDLGYENRFQFRKGLDDQDFPWHFAPAVATDVVAQMERDGHITPEQRQAMTFGDWANVIGSGWFADLMHDLALTSNGVWGDFGRDANVYGDPVALKDKALGYGANVDRVFDTELTYEDETGDTYITASVNPDFRRKLRERIKGTDSRGCPVARHAGTLSLDLVQSDPHAQALIERGDLVLGDVTADGTKVRFTQPTTPIDEALMSFAGHLDRYDRRYGTPYFDVKDWRLTHDFAEPTDVLILHPEIED